jgi:hypothetical protein
MATPQTADPDRPMDIFRETGPTKSFVHRSPLWLGDEDFLAVPVEVFAPGNLGVVGEQQGVQERRAAVVLPG